MFEDPAMLHGHGGGLGGLVLPSVAALLRVELSFS